MSLFLIGKAIYSCCVNDANVQLQRGVGMSRAYWACIGLMILGFVLFLYGANHYDATAGWAGEYIFVLGIIAALVVYIYHELTKTRNQKP